MQWNKVLTCEPTENDSWKMWKRVLVAEEGLRFHQQNPSISLPICKTCYDHHWSTNRDLCPRPFCFVFFFFSVLFCKILYFSYFSHCQKLIISSITFWLKWETIYLRLTHMISANKREKKGDRLEVGADCGVVTLYSISILWKVKHYSFERWSLLLLLCPIIHRPLFYSILFYFLFVLTSFSVHFNFSPRCFW